MIPAAAVSARPAIVRIPISLPLPLPLAPSLDVALALAFVLLGAAKGGELALHCSAIAKLVTVLRLVVVVVVVVSIFVFVFVFLFLRAFLFRAGGKCRQRRRLRLVVFDRLLYLVKLEVLLVAVVVEHVEESRIYAVCGDPPDDNAVHRHLGEASPNLLANERVAHGEPVVATPAELSGGVHYALLARASGSTEPPGPATLLVAFLVVLVLVVLVLLLVPLITAFGTARGARVGTGTPPAWITLRRSRDRKGRRDGGRSRGRGTAG